MNPISCPIMIFAKAPVPGEVKTRLIPMLGPVGAAMLHEGLLLQSLTTALQAGAGPVHLWCAPSSEHPFFGQCAKEFGVELCDQPDGDLGARLAHAFKQTLTAASCAVTIGSDSPSLTSADVQEAAAALAQGADAVLGPAEDGGYVLLGLRRFAPEVFSGVTWSSEKVASETRVRLRALNWRWHELPQRWDIDRPEDLARFLANRGSPMGTA